MADWANGRKGERLGELRWVSVGFIIKLWVAMRHSAEDVNSICVI